MKRRMKNLCDERRYRVERRAAPQHLGAETASAEAGQKDKGDDAEGEGDSRCSRYSSPVSRDSLQPQRRASLGVAARAPNFC